MTKKLSKTIEKMNFSIYNISVRNAKALKEKKI